MPNRFKILLLSAIGVLAGGYLADKTSRHADLTAIAYGVNALIVLGIAILSLAPFVIVGALAVAGFLSGLIAPSRDMLVRQVAPPGAAGRAFGIVTTGFNMGSAVGPMLFGWIMDGGHPRWVFGGAVVFMLTTVLVSLISERRLPKTYAVGRQPA